MIFPDLPPNFWANFPNNIVPASSSWQPIAAHKAIASIAPGRSEIAGFEWLVPSSAAGQLALLAIISAQNDTLVTTELNVPTLVTMEKKCGLRNVAIVNPPAHVGPSLVALPLALDVSAGYIPSLQLDRRSAALIRGVLFSTRMASIAMKAGWKRVRLTREDKLALDRLKTDAPAVVARLRTDVAFAPRPGLLDSGGPATTQDEPFVVFLQPDPRAGYGSVVQIARDGRVLGGITLQAR
jgi:hypothetical protein